MAPVAAAAIFAGGAIAASQSASNAQKRAQQSAEDFARSQQEQAIAEQRRLEEKFGLTPGELEREEASFELEKKRQSELERRADLSGEDLLREVGPTTRALIDKVAQRSGKTGEELFREEGGRVAELLLDELTREEPLAIFEPELERAFQGVKQELNRRGVLGTGLPGSITAEGLGRAGVDAAVAAAKERLDRRTELANNLFNISAGARQEAGTLAERALSEQTGARDELGAFLKDIQILSQNARGRAADVAVSSSATAQNSVNQGFQSLQDVAGFQAGTAAAQRADAQGTLADLGGTILGEVLTRSRKQDQEEEKITPPGEVEDRDPIEELLRFRRGF